jgi:type IX secretion system PorP/SprF family membrane protein
MIVLVLLSGSLLGQDPRLSQFYAAPMQVNPALCGVFEGRYRGAMNYRVLYPTLFSERPFRTYSASAEWRSRIVNRDYAGFGVAVQQDEAGTAGFERSNFMFGASFLKQLSGGRGASTEHYLVAGAQAGLLQHALQGDRLWFSSQYDRGGNRVDQGLPSGEPVSGPLRGVNPDLQAGLLWYAVFDENASIYAGAALHHILSPDISLLDGEGVALFRRWTVHGGGEIPFSKQLSALPAIMVTSQGPSLSATTGANIRYANPYWRDLALRSGLWAHLSNQSAGDNPSLGLDALVFVAVFELERWNLGFSYDVTASSLRRSNYSRGAFEIALTYFHPAKERYRVRCPKY